MNIVEKINNHICQNFLHNSIKVPHPFERYHIVELFLGSAPVKNDFYHQSSMTLDEYKKLIKKYSVGK
jgi:hypothetical protein